MNANVRIVIVALVASAAGGCATTAYESNDQAVDDSTITANVKAALVQDPTTRARNISVNTLRGVVELSGFVDSRAERSEAAQVASNIAGVRSVEDQLQINSDSRVVGTAVDDDTITTRVKSALAANPDTDSNQIRVTTSHGVVQLAGFVNSNEQRAAAANVANSVQGVRAVDNDLRLTPP